MDRTRVGVVRGGPSHEYEVSLNTGASILRALDRERYTPVDIFISRDGKWHIDGVEANIDQVHQTTDVVFNALHGKYGEDGGIQRDLEYFGIPYTGSGVFPSAIAMNKAHAKEYFRAEEIPTPEARMIRKDDDVRQKLLEAFQTLPAPYVVKPVAGGSSIGVEVVHAFDDLSRTVRSLLTEEEAVLVEMVVRGREITCGVVEGKDGNIYPLAPVEIAVPDDRGHFDYEGKYDGSIEEICPADLSPEETATIQSYAEAAHRALGLRHYSRTDFLLTPNGIYVLEVNTLPGLTERSLLPRSLAVAGIELPEFVDHLLTLASLRR